MSEHYFCAQCEENEVIVKKMSHNHVEEGLKKGLGRGYECTGVNLSGHVRLLITSKVFSRAAKIDRKSMKAKTTKNGNRTHPPSLQNSGINVQ